MDFNDYQKLTGTTAMYPEGQLGLAYLVLGLTGESGEVAEKVKKLIRNNDGQITEDFVTELGKELGDTLWYLSEICSYMGLRLEDVARGNIAKLQDRASRGVIKSKGDNR